MADAAALDRVGNCPAADVAFASSPHNRLVRTKATQYSSTLKNTSSSRIKSPNLSSLFITRVGFCEPLEEGLRKSFAPVKNCIALIIGVVPQNVLSL